MIPRLIQQSGLLRAHYPGVPSGERSDKREGTWVPNTVLGSDLHFSFVARDWRGAVSTDGKPLVFDRVRLLSSSRMAVQRVSLAGGRLLPYAEISFGQWRADPDLMPFLRCDSELAAQVTAGVEVRLAHHAAIAWDVERTTMYRDPRDPTNLPFVNILGSFAAVRAEF